jgi:hypothetical protein
LLPEALQTLCVGYKRGLSLSVWLLPIASLIKNQFSLIATTSNGFYADKVAEDALHGQLLCDRTPEQM